MSLMEERRAQLYPRLGDAQVARIAALGVRRRVARGEILFEQRQVHRCLGYVVQAHPVGIEPSLHLACAAAVHVTLHIQTARSHPWDAPATAHPSEHGWSPPSPV